MYARVARWEGAEAEKLNNSAARIREEEEANGGPPEGLPAKALLLLNDPEAGKSMAITLFETEEDYVKGDAKLNEMSPPGEGMGQRVSVEKFQVAVKFET